MSEHPNLPLPGLRTDAQKFEDALDCPDDAERDGAEAD